MPSFAIRLLISTIVTLHLAMVALAMLGHRGASFLHDDILSFIAPYTAFGNWKADTNRMPIASSNALEEIIRIEWHARDSADDAWLPLVPEEQSDRIPPRWTMNRKQRLEQYWLHQLSGLLIYENDEGVGRMLIACLNGRNLEPRMQIDKIRVTVAPRLSQQQYIEVQALEDASALPETLQPQVAYAATVVDLGDGELSLLRQTEARRASRTVEPLIPSPSRTGLQP